ncbi:M20/M25/M40 family metallo-hydrolase [Virgibacillus halodenitrificans]|uniref:Endoglucanase n=1 Tax=Virgibacillus halodenitrificans TaxID=1482 RepID=A0AAC9J369_VIRHA|nr:M20/M25/M40 family metallo-hydrolase [Virgibacillus halodenitrificans]APC48905.1 endoglucanase [Virgibacillus halodenitrificans]MCG1026999.1 M20/M25/M40 family metallo-hydrolase [Virgibacillus halodenitrificans]MCJ0933305.1 M20/M25/M40 family metallo-hydrolase [Virgibacillus halodenitrificans]MEC2159046.1 M20/M25/M40 family metallo-hydrolase [Virgibacillus halodenitrificans]CDQ30678.1 Putative aminopeptidase YsdC [Virgibacillus halodenitrificans]
MPKANQDFLLELLHTASPSSNEVAIQKKWINYVKTFADEIRTDHAGNAIGVLNPDARFKILLAGHCDEIALVINRIDEDGFLHFDKMGGINPQAAVGMKVTVMGENTSVTGVIGVNAQHHGGIKKDFDLEDLFIDCGYKTKGEAEDYIQIGDLAVYKTEPEILSDRYISGRGLDNRTGSFIVAEVLKNLAERGCSVGVYAASTVNEETNMGGAYFAAAGIEPTMAIACDVTFATDFPGVNKNKHGDIRLEKGPVFAKGAPINKKINRLLEQTAKKLQMAVQYELTPRMTGTDADKMRLTGKGVPVSLVSLPLRYMHSPVETASLKDIDEEIELLVEMIANLTGEENLNPLED